MQCLFGIINLYLCQVIWQQCIYLKYAAFDRSGCALPQVKTRYHMTVWLNKPADDVVSVHKLHFINDALFQIGNVSNLNAANLLLLT